MPIDANTAARFWSKVNKDGPTMAHMTTPCWIWRGAHDKKSGYARMLFDGQMRQASRVAWLVAHGERPHLFVCHHCDNRGCVRPEHLFVGSHLDNMADMVTKGRHAWVAHPGATNGRATLTPDDVDVIRATTGKTKALAAMFGVDRTTIQRARRNETWAADAALAGSGS